MSTLASLIRVQAVNHMHVDASLSRRPPFRCRLTPSRGHVTRAVLQPRAQAQVPQQQQQQQKQQQQQPPPQDNRELIRSLPPVRSAAPPPEAIAVQHSSSFLYRQRREELGVDPDVPLPSYSSSERSWREDARDTNMTAATGIANAAKATAEASGKVLSVAVPVGGWALRQGFKAAKGALKRNNAKQPGKRSKGSADDNK